MKLTDRLLKIASLVDKDKRLADIGTDHGYIPVYLLNKNTIQYAILGDVNKGPLDNAKKEVMRNNLIDKVGLDYIQSIIDRNDAIAASKLMLGFFKGGEKNEL